MIIPTEDNTKTVTDLRENVVGILASLKKQKGPQFVFYKSKPKAVLLAIAEYQKLLELLEDYEDAAEASEIIANAKAKKEKLYPFKKVIKALDYQPREAK